MEATEPEDRYARQDQRQHSAMGEVAPTAPCGRGNRPVGREPVRGVRQGNV